MQNVPGNTHETLTGISTGPRRETERSVEGPGPRVLDVAKGKRQCRAGGGRALSCWLPAHGNVCSHLVHTISDFTLDSDGADDARFNPDESSSDSDSCDIDVSASVGLKPTPAWTGEGQASEMGLGLVLPAIRCKRNH